MDMSTFTVPDIGLQDSDRQSIRALARSLSAEQALWVSGYFAGAAEARADLMALSSSEANAVISRSRAGQSQTGLLRILYATESGNAAALAREIEGRARDAGLQASVEDLARYKTRGLAEEETVLFIASTHGEGDPPEPAAPFFEFLSGRKAPPLERLRFAVLALGDSTYEFFCEAGKRLDQRLEELGAERIMDRCDCDVDYEADAQRWTDLLLTRLQTDASASAPAGPAAGGPALSLAQTPTTPAHGKGNPFPAQIVESVRLTGRGSSKGTRHLELELGGSGLAYLPGDALGVVPRNDPALVAEIVEQLGWSGTEQVAGRTGKLAIAQALESEFEIVALTPRFVEGWAALSGNGELTELATKRPRAELAGFMAANQIIDVLRASPARGVTPQDFVQTLRTLQPRLYSIASSAELVPDEVHICVAPVHYRLNERDRHGVASRHLAEQLTSGDSVPVYVQQNDNFRLPQDPGTPIVMIGAGTGVAPYRAFMQHREALGIAGRSWLFFGERNFRSDFLYQTEWQEWHRSGALTRIDLAFSRDQQEKIYVQHRLLARGNELFEWLDDGAHLYVCGDAQSMAHDVHSALLTVIENCRARGREDAEAYLRELQASGRYQRDVY